MYQHLGLKGVFGGSVMNECWTKDFGMVWGCQMAGTEHLKV